MKYYNDNGRHNLRRFTVQKKKAGSLYNEIKHGKLPHYTKVHSFQSTLNIGSASHPPRREKWNQISNRYLPSDPAAAPPKHRYLFCTHQLSSCNLAEQQQKGRSSLHYSIVVVGRLNLVLQYPLPLPPK